jgi:transposase-like protein
VSQGASISEVCRRYDIKGGGSVQGWIKQFGREELLNKIVRIEMKGEQDKLKQLEKELKATKIALADKTMALDAMEALVEIANKYYNTDLKKNFGQKQSQEYTRMKKYSINSLLSIYTGYIRYAYYKSLVYSENRQFEILPATPYYLHIRRIICTFALYFIVE